MLLVRKKVTNRIAKAWIAKELAKKDRTKVTPKTLDFQGFF